MESSQSSSADTEKPAPPDAAPDELIGRCLNGTYQIEAVLGEGGVGRVYRARHARIKTKQFALKVLHPEHSRDPQQLARFQVEAEAAASLSHPNVVGVFDVGRTEDGFSYLACELLHGIDLDAQLDKVTKLQVSEAVHVALQICEALESAHAQNIVHRDLKPQNVFLMADVSGDVPSLPAVKLVDFGLSRFLDHADAQLTKTGTLMGTPTFMAPEQATGARGDHRVDVYGVGVILYVALTGRPPFIEETLPAMLVAVMTEEPPRPRKLVPDIPEALELIIQRAMAKQPEERYQTIAALRTALEAVVEGDEPRQQLSTRARFPSSVQQAEAAYELKTSRLRLIYYAACGALFFIACLLAAVSGLEIFTGPLEFSRMELALISAGICGTIVTPAVLAFRHFRQSVWSNSAKVMVLLTRLRTPLLVGLVTYGASSAALRFGDDFMSRLGQAELFERSLGLGWSGFTWVVPMAAVVAAVLSFVKLRMSEGAGTRRPWLGGVLHVVSIVAVLAVLWGGLLWRKADLERRRELAAAGVLESAIPDQGGSETAPSQAAEAEEVIQLASDEELAAALEKGVDGLLPLSEKYPQDARILEPLLVEFASRATGFADAMVTAQRLVAVAPEKKDSETLGLMVRRAAESPGKASELAFKLMRDDLGSAGPDLLFQLSKNGSKASSRAKEVLDEPEVREKMSPALRIALELEAAESCEARLPLLARAKALGDLRSSSLLSPLARGTKTGCGKWKNRPCPAHCKEQAKEYLEAAQAIQMRASGTTL